MAQILLFFLNCCTKGFVIFGSASAKLLIGLICSAVSEKEE